MNQPEHFGFLDKFNRDENGVPTTYAPTNDDNGTTIPMYAITPPQPLSAKLLSEQRAPNHIFLVFGKKRTVNPQNEDQGELALH